MRQETLQRHPRLRDALKMLGGLITVQEMRRLNFQVDGKRRGVREVVEEFLRKKGSIS